MRITKCRVCSSTKLAPILSLGKQKLSDFTKVIKKMPAFPLNIMLCKECKLVQLDYTTPSKYLYTERYGYRSGVNQTMRDELKDIVVESMKKLKKIKNFTAVDIGANDGTLLSFYPKGVFRISVEPVKKLAKESQKHADVVINDFFNHKAYTKKVNSKADLITIISCFYDMQNPNKFVKDVIKVMKDDAVVVIQQNYLVEMLKNNAFDNIVHEHLEYYSLLSLNNLLDRHNLQVFDVEIRDLNGGSFRTFIAKKGNMKISKNVEKLIHQEKKLGLHTKKVYADFAKRIKSNKITLNNFLNKKIADGKKVYIYGASTRGNTLLQYYNIGKKLIPYAVERNPEKWGKNISSVGIPIISEKQARKDKPDYLLVLPWFFKKEFLLRESEYLKSGGHFIFPLPEVKII